MSLHSCEHQSCRYYMRYTSLTVDKKLNSLIYRILFYVNMYGSYKLLKCVRFLAHPVYLRRVGKHEDAIFYLSMDDQSSYRFGMVYKGPS